MLHWDAKKPGATDDYDLDWSQRLEGIETAAPPTRAVDTRTSNLLSLFTLLRPMELFDAKNKSSLGIVARYDSGGAG